MLDTLWLIFKGLLLVFGILMVASAIISILIEPLKKKKREKAKMEFLEELNRIASKCAEELKKEESKPKTTKKPRATKKKEDK